MIGPGHAVAALALLAALASDARAQAVRPSTRPSRFTVSAGLVADGGYGVGERTAGLRSNAGAAAPFVLFHSDGRLEGMLGFDARVGYALSRTIGVEVSGTFGAPQLSVAITQDAESAANATVGESTSQYTVDVGATVQLPWRSAGGRIGSYGIGGAGYLRQLHDDRLLLETGHTIFGGGGLLYSFGSATRRHPRGLRGEVRYVYRAGGIDFEDKSRGHVSVRALGFLGF